MLARSFGVGLTLLALGLALAIPSGSRAQDTCDVVVAFDDAGPVPMVA